MHRYPVSDTDRINRKELEEILSEIRKLEDYYHIIYYTQGSRVHPWEHADVEQLSLQDKEKIQELLENIYNEGSKFLKNLEELNNHTIFKLVFDKKRDGSGSTMVGLAHIKTFIQIGLKYDLSIISKDLNKISKTIKSHNDSFFRFFKPSYIKQLKTMNDYLRVGKEIVQDSWWLFSSKKALEDLEILMDVKKNLLNKDKAKGNLGKFFKKDDDADDNQESFQIEQWLEDNENIPDTIYEYIEEYALLVNDREEYILSYWKDSSVEFSLEIILKQSQRMDDLDEWIRFNNIIKKLNSLGMEDYTERLTSGGWESMEGKVDPGQFVDVYKKRFYTIWLDEHETKNDVLRNFNLFNTNQLLETFRDLDVKQRKHAKMRLTNDIVDNFPSRVSAKTSSSGISVLLREINKKRAHLSMRRLFKKIPHIIMNH